MATERRKGRPGHVGLHYEGISAVTAAIDSVAARTSRRMEPSYSRVSL